MSTSFCKIYITADCMDICGSWPFSIHEIFITDPKSFKREMDPANDTGNSGPQLV